jgi:hypothetical protein
MFVVGEVLVGSVSAYMRKDKVAYLNRVFNETVRFQSMLYDWRKMSAVKARLTVLLLV